MTEDPHSSDRLLIDRVREHDATAWQAMIERFEGRLLAFVENRVGNRAAAEDIVQETFVGFLTSLPNYDPDRPLESWLFSIAAHKMTDHLRREGRRPTVPLVAGSTMDGGLFEPSGTGRPASSIMRSSERRNFEEQALIEAIQSQLDRWVHRKDWEKLACIELLMVTGLPNKEVATKLNITEQVVANHKFQFLATLRNAVKRQNLPEEVFPDLYEEEN